MDNFLPTIILRHRKENLKKCSLRGLERSPHFKFYTYPLNEPLPCLHYVTLDLEAEPLSRKDRDLGLLIIDGTWKYAKKMVTTLEDCQSLIKRSIPREFVTAYPRKQTDCPDPERGLASIEAIYIAYRILQRDPSQLLDNYYWKNQFLLINEKAFSNY